MSDVTAYTAKLFGPFDPEPNLTELHAQLRKYNVTHFRTVGGRVHKTVGRLNKKSVPYSAVTVATWPYQRIESFGCAPLDHYEQAWIDRLGGNQWR